MEEFAINEIQKELTILEDIYDSLDDSDPKKQSCLEEIEKLKSILEKSV